jgi:hypothetical protein
VGELHPVDIPNGGAIAANICQSCGFAFALFGIMINEEGTPSELYPVEEQKISRPLFCPMCGTDLKSFAAEQNLDLAKLMRWKKWAAQ